jgi:SAM-dependent methyltransferase
VYYASKLHILREIFGSDDVELFQDSLKVNGRTYPIIDDVIIMLDLAQYPAWLRNRLAINDAIEKEPIADFAEDIQFTFGEEWVQHSEILPDHEKLFQQYFDLVNFEQLADKRVCDLGCGMGRWSYFLQDKCRELILVDFSDAVFVARRNLANSNALFFMADIKRLPFKSNFADFIVCLGVLHHLPTNALDEVRELRRYAPTLLVYLYYALDNRPAYFRFLLGAVTYIRTLCSQVRSRRLRAAITAAIATIVYRPLIVLGKALATFNLSQSVPLYDMYHNKSVKQVKQDVYDRFFTRIEQRVSRKEIYQLGDSFADVQISKGLPYWHFLCRR